MEKPTIRTPQDLRNLSNYVESVDPDVRPLLRIITGYYLSEEYHCGLKSCHQPHKEGFLVELEDGGLTNVGWKCGERFGKRFALERARYAEQELRPKAIRAIQEVIGKIQGMTDELGHLAVEADRLSRCKHSMRGQFPKLYRELKRRADSGDDKVTEQVERQREEIDNLQAMNPGTSRERFRYYEAPRGVLPGLRVLAISIRANVITDLTGSASELLITNAAELPVQKLLEWERWARNFDEVLGRARGAIAAGDAFFEQESFRLMAYIAIDPAEKARLSKLSAEALLLDKGGLAQTQAALVVPAVRSKKDRDNQKRLEAILRSAKRYER